MQGSVAVVCGRLWGNAAVENRARLEIEAFVAAGLDVDVLTEQPIDDRARVLWPELVAQGPVVAPPGRLMRRTSTKLVSFTWATQRFLAGSRGRVTGTVVSHSPAGVVGALWWHRRRSRRLIYVCHQSPRPFGQGLPRRHRPAARIVHLALEAIALRWADLVVCPAPSSRDFYAGRRRGRAIISLENPVDLERFEPDDHVSKDIDVLFVGRLAEEKGPVVLLEALSRLTHPHRTVLIGSGTQRQRLEQLAATSPSPVELLGAVPNEELPGWYQRARVVAVPSFTEAAGMVPVEAMASGTPVVASRVVGLVDSVDDGVNGWLVPAGNTEALAAVLDRVLTDEHELARAGRAARASVDRFDARGFGARALGAYGLA